MDWVPFAGVSRRTVWKVDGYNGENNRKVPDVAPAEGWWRAIKAAAVCGMVRDWPGPSSGRESGGTTQAADLRMGHARS
jgi:hypothetical protein